MFCYNSQCCKTDILSFPFWEINTTFNISFKKKWRWSSETEILFFSLISIWPVFYAGVYSAVRQHRFYSTWTCYLKALRKKYNCQVKLCKSQYNTITEGIVQRPPFNTMHTLMTGYEFHTLIMSKFILWMYKHMGVMELCPCGLYCCITNTVC